MDGSLRLGDFAGIRVQVHWTFWLLILFVVFYVFSQNGSLNEMLWSTGFILVLFTCVVFHEFGHALTARNYGIGTRSITLLPIGGVASLKKMPEDPKAEFMIAVAGPAVNAAIALILYLIIPVESFLAQDPETLQNELSRIRDDNFLFYLFSANVALAAFNMLPAFPLDGGRVLRSLLSIRMGRVRATQVAVTTGKFLALMLFLFGLFYNFILVLIALFIYFGAESENVMVMQLNVLKGYQVKDAMITRFTPLHPEETLDDVIRVILKGTEKNFVVAEENSVLGILLMADLSAAIDSRGRETRVREVMMKDVKTLQPDEPLTKAYQELLYNKNRIFPVIRLDEIAGVIDMENLNEFLRLKASIHY